MKAPPQVLLGLLLERGDAGHGDLHFEVSLNGVEVKAGQAEARWDPEELQLRFENDIGHKGRSNDPYSTICGQFVNC